MTDDNDPLTAPVSAPVVAEPELTAGALIRQAREAAGLHIAALAVSLKVPVKRLEALEADRFDLLPDAVFTRALAGSVCRTLKLDPAPVLERLPSQSTPRLSQQMESRRALHGATIYSRRSPWLAAMSRPAVLGGMLLLVAALALALLPPLDFAWTQAEQPESDTVTTQTLPMMSVEPSSPERAQSAPVAALGPANVNSSAAVSGLVAPAARLAPAAVPATSGMLVFKASAESWVEVTDAKGTLLLSRKLLAGDAAEASGAPPLSVVVGRADVTQVQVRGQPLDLAPVSRGNVARFEVK